MALWSSIKKPFYKSEKSFRPLQWVRKISQAKLQKYIRDSQRISMYLTTFRISWSQLMDFWSRSIPPQGNLSTSLWWVKRIRSYSRLEGRFSFENSHNMTLYLTQRWWLYRIQKGTGTLSLLQCTPKVYLPKLITSWMLKIWPPFLFSLRSQQTLTWRTTIKWSSN